MKLAKLSLAAIVVAGLATSSFAADTLADAFKNGKVAGTLKAFYIDSNVDAAASDTSAFATGGELGYKTDSLYGFSAGVTFQTSHTMGLDTTDNNDGTVAIQKTLLSEAYLAYTLDKTTVQAGRMYLDTPLASTSGSRLMKDSFEALMITNTSLPNTTLAAVAVDKTISRSGGITNLDDRIYSIYVNNKSIANLELTAQYATHDKDGDDYYVDAVYKLPTKLPVTLGAQYIAVQYDDTTVTKDSSLYGLMASTEVAGFGLGAYFNSTDSDYSVRGGHGGGSDWSYNSVQYLSGNTAGTDSYRGMVSYDFSKVGLAGLSAFVTYAKYNQDVANGDNDANEFDIDATYAFSGALKGLTARVRYADVNYDAKGAAGNPDLTELRFIAAYKF